MQVASPAGTIGGALFGHMHWLGMNQIDAGKIFVSELSLIALVGT